MNHTFKGIIIVVAITSMMVLGATTTVPIMQNSFASKKSDFKQAEGDPNTNTNTNTNSADSSSSSTATADNTNNINNTATASQSQEQSACAVAVTCPECSTTVTSTPPPPPTPPAGCPAGTLYDVNFPAVPNFVELCLPGNPGGNPLGAQTATIAGTSTTIPVIITNPNTATCPIVNSRSEVTSGQENVPGLNTVCVQINR